MIACSVIAAALGIGFIVYGTTLVRVLTASSATRNNVSAVFKLTLVAVTCAVYGAAVLLYTTFALVAYKIHAVTHPYPVAWSTLCRRTGLPTFGRVSNDYAAAHILYAEAANHRLEPMRCTEWSVTLLKHVALLFSTHG